MSLKFIASVQNGAPNRPHRNDHYTAETDKYSVAVISDANSEEKVWLHLKQENPSTAKRAARCAWLFRRFVEITHNRSCPRRHVTQQGLFGCYAARVLNRSAHAIKLTLFVNWLCSTYDRDSGPAEGESLWKQNALSAQEGGRG
jgi:hypothetical protein